MIVAVAPQAGDEQGSQELQRRETVQVEGVVPLSVVRSSPWILIVFSGPFKRVGIRTKGIRIETLASNRRHGDSLWLTAMSWYAHMVEENL